MKLDRLLAITMLLVNRNRVSAKELAEHFEVSVRTIHRDIEAINRSGIPIVAYQGNKGGFGIMENYRIDRNVLTSDEVISIITALNGIRSTLEDKKITNTLEKIKGLIPEKELEDLKRKKGQIIIDFNPWGADRKEKAKLAIMKDAMEDSKVISFNYTNSKGETFLRNVEPVSLWFKGNFWYLYAYCRLKSEFRIFRLSRIKDLFMTEESYIPREVPSVVNDAGKGWGGESHATSITLKFSSRVRGRVEDYFYEDQLEFQEDGSIIAEVEFQEDEWVYGTILSYGEDVEVLKPERLRSIIKEKAVKIADKYKLNEQT